GPQLILLRGREEAVVGVFLVEVARCTRRRAAVEDHSDRGGAFGDPRDERVKFPIEEELPLDSADLVLWQERLAREPPFRLVGHNTLRTVARVINEDAVARADLVGAQARKLSTNLFERWQRLGYVCLMHCSRARRGQARDAIARDPDTIDQEAL